MIDTPPILLLCTVGGSHEPILTALRQTTPDFTCFICTDRDPATNRPGSDVQIVGPGSCIKARPSDEKPTLPNIPTQAGLREDQYEVVHVPADDLDEVFRLLRAAIQNLGQRFPGARLLADYTGGTKTMTAGLVSAALESDGVELQLVTGSRADLIKVRSGMEAVTQANVERVRLERAMRPYVAAWHRFAYAEAYQGLAALPRPRDRTLAARLALLRDLSRGLDAWDRFEHGAALDLLEPYRPRIGANWSALLLALKRLTAPDEGQEPARLLDLWRNAERRAAQGRYDDAAARVYRLLEWSAQWLLRGRCGLDTGDVPPDRVPPGMALAPNDKGRIQVGLMAAWELLAHHQPDSPAGAFFRAERNALLDWLRMRNQSILAHGFQPVVESDWRKTMDWVNARLLPVLLQETAGLRIKEVPPQLPGRPPAE
ncbi:MAG: TIGR02710 family CRISPR-associated protein [Candidatus Competibacteraceae bacterium]|nr:MAG: TIGR02710 family CRISPR-associated protein [Candidatus Competibacteraceae bacterium]